jgi:hypothetical protein
VHHKGYCVGYHNKLNLDNSTFEILFTQIFKEKNMEQPLNIIYFISNNNNDNKIFKNSKILLNVYPIFFPKHGKQQGYQTFTIYYFPSFGGKKIFIFQKKSSFEVKKVLYFVSIT